MNAWLLARLTDGSERCVFVGIRVDLSKEEGLKYWVY